MMTRSLSIGERGGAIPTVIFRIGVLALATETMELGLPDAISLFRIVVAPLYGLGILLLVTKGFSAREWIGLVAMATVAAFMALTGASSSSLDLLLASAGVLIVATYSYLYTLSYGLNTTDILTFAAFGLPHLLAWGGGALGVIGDVYRDVSGRYQGPFKGPNFAARTLIIAVGAQLSLIKKTNWRSVGSVILAAVLAIETIILLQTASRAALVCLVAMLGIWATLAFGRRGGAAFLTVSVCVWGIIYAAVDWNTLSWTSRNPILLLAYRMTSIGGEQIPRLHLWIDAVAALGNGHWFLGPSVEAYLQDYSVYPHSSLIDAYLDSGYIGGSIFLAIIGYSSQSVLKAADRSGWYVTVALLFVGVTLMIGVVSSFRRKLVWSVISIALASVVRRPTAESQDVLSGTGNRLYRHEK